MVTSLYLYRWKALKAASPVTKVQLATSSALHRSFIYEKKLQRTYKMQQSSRDLRTGADLISGLLAAAWSNVCLLAR